MGNKLTSAYTCTSIDMLQVQISYYLMEGKWSIVIAQAGTSSRSLSIYLANLLVFIRPAYKFIPR